MMSACNMALCFERGQGVAADQKLAFEIFKNVADIENATADKNIISQAQAKLANYYGNGIGVAQSYIQSAIYLQKAADNGNNNSLLGLALYYEEGKGVPKDEARCVALLKKSAEKGCSQASEKLVQKGYNLGL